MSAAVQTPSSTPLPSTNPRRSEEPTRPPTSARVVVPVVGSGKRAASPPPSNRAPHASPEVVPARSQSSISSDSTNASREHASSDRDEVSQASSSTEEEPSSEWVPEPEFIHMETFRQILDLDDEDDDEFSRGMVEAYFSQADSTFKDMDKAFAEKNLPELSSLGHFLKGSSAALGVCKVQASCERMQHYGQLRDEENNTDLTRERALEKIEELLAKVKKDHREAQTWLENYFKNRED